jgi:hypothetical protein
LAGRQWAQIEAPDGARIKAGAGALDAMVAKASAKAGVTGLNVTLHYELPTIDWYFRDRGRLVHKFCHFFLMEAAHGEARPQEAEGISACMWLPFDDAVKTLTYANAREVLTSAAQRLGKAGDAAVSTGA